MKAIHKKAQLEIMGLIVVVVLLTLGMFFMVALKAKQPSSNVKNAFQDDQLASSFTTTMLKTNANCQKFTMKDMIQDCAVEKNIVCDGKKSCDYVNDSIFVFLNQTLIKWNKKFRLELSNIALFEYECTNRQERDSATQIIPLYPYPGEVIVKLDICKY